MDNIKAVLSSSAYASHDPDQIKIAIADVLTKFDEKLASIDANPKIVQEASAEQEHDDSIGSLKKTLLKLLDRKPPERTGDK